MRGGWKAQEALRRESQRMFSEKSSLLDPAHPVWEPCRQPLARVNCTVLRPSRGEDETSVGEYIWSWFLEEHTGPNPNKWLPYYRSLLQQLIVDTPGSVFGCDEGHSNCRNRGCLARIIIIRLQAITLKFFIFIIAQQIAHLNQLDVLFKM